VCVVLAAGASRRFGSLKLLEHVGGRRMIDRVLAACGERETVVVATPSLAAQLEPAPGRRIAINAEPERGMTHSLRLASALVDPDAALVVLLGDMPYIDRALVERAIDAFDSACDLLAPTCAGRPAHPVILGPAARARLAALPEGDTLRALRTDARLRVRALVLTDASTQRDVDVPGDL
jgi:CTP:molybdopterin cytidylyltransferase MocA